MQTKAVDGTPRVIQKGDFMRISATALAVIAGVAAAALVALVHQGYQKAQRDPAFCTSCHGDTAGLAGHTVRSHPGLDCQACHPAGTLDGLMLLFDDLRGSTGDAVTTHGASPTDLCRDCHRNEGPSIVDSAGHIAHEKADEKTTCVECHKSTAHTGRPGDDGCIECHPNDKVKASAMAEVHCLTCHDYLAPEPDAARRPGFARCERCHGKTDGEGTRIELHAEMPCATCHQPHKEPFTIARACETCHEKVQHAHPEVEGRNGDAYCTTCHGPHDDWGQAVERCQTCHEDVLLAALPRRIANVAPVGDELLEAIAAQAAHVSCAECHPAHDRSGEGAMRASTKTCGDCHEDAKPLTVPHKREACNACHEPHTPLPRDCSECHAPSIRHGGEDCASCHRVHETPDFVRPTCDTCHEKIMPAAGGGPTAGHPKTECGECHAPHAAPGKVKPCVECHADQVKAVSGLPDKHKNCAECHKPHVWKSPTCTECHKEETAEVAPIEKHRDCAACHQSHTMKVDRAKTCNDCHKDTVAQAARDHRTCDECHRPHDGARGKPAGRKECVDCHEAKFTPPAGVPKHVECKDCHQVHVGPGEGPPKCAKCHEPGSLKAGGALHVVKEHQTCDDCHRAHGGVDASRAACTKCHEDQKDHEPRAPVCNGCHNFR